MPLPHDDATANLVIDGLAICCFDKGTKDRWDVGFLRHKQHNHVLLLTIDGHPHPPIEFVDEKGTIIRIKTDQGVSPFNDFPLGFFDKGPISVDDRKKPPKDLDAAENFRWTINLEEPVLDIGHGKGKLLKPKSLSNMTRALIENAVFYTARRPLKTLLRLLNTDDAATMSDPQLALLRFGKTNDLIGADITCKLGGGINIIIERPNQQPETIPLPHRPGNPWQISLTNLRPGLAELHRSETGEGSHSGHEPQLTLRADKPRKGDFQLYYDIFELNDKREERALWGFPEALSLLSGRTDCNSVWVGTSTNLDDLFK